MVYVFCLYFPLLFSLLVQGLLWVGTFWHIGWLDRIAMLGIAAGGLFGSCIALMLYRLIAIGRPFSIGLSLASLLQFAALANSLLFLYSAYVGVFPAFMQSLL